MSDDDRRFKDIERRLGVVERKAVSGTSVDAQPLDDDLTAIANQGTNAAGRLLLVATSAAQIRNMLALGTAATQDAGAFDVAGAAQGWAYIVGSASQPLNPTLTGISTVGIGRAGDVVENIGLDPGGPQINNTTTTTTLHLNGAVGIDPIIKGDVIRITAHGTYGNNTGATRTLTIGLYLGFGMRVQVVSGAIPANFFQRTWRATFEMIVLNASATGRAVFTGAFRISTPAGTSPEAVGDGFATAIADPIDIANVGQAVSLRATHGGLGSFTQAWCILVEKINGSD